MAAKKSQAEAEELVKNYQLDAVENQVQQIQKQMTEGFAQANEGIKTLIENTKSQVSPQQLTDNLTALRSDFTRQMKESEKIQDTKMYSLGKDTMKVAKDMNRFTWIVIGTGVSIIGVAVTIIMKAGGG